MKTFLLLILSLMAVCVASLTVMVCQEGWVEFTCYYPEEAEEEYDRVVVKGPNRRRIQSTVQDQWENRGRVSLYHNTDTKTLKVAIKNLKPEDSGEYKCQFKTSSDEEEVEVVVNIEELQSCQRQSIQTASTITDITCNYPENYMSGDKFFCKENDYTCEDILNERFTLTQTHRSLNIFINHVSPSDTGVYWCGVKTERYQAALTRIQLEVKGRALLTVIIAVVVCAVLLVLVLILVFIYKRYQHSKNTVNKNAQNDQEDPAYEEIQERPREPDSGTAIKTIYTTAIFDTNTSPGIHHYSNSCVKNSSVEFNDGDPYSTVNNNDQHPVYSTLNHPSGLSED